MCRCDNLMRVTVMQGASNAGRWCQTGYDNGKTCHCPCDAKSDPYQPEHICSVSCSN
jgi:hypothetical protein